MSETSLPNVLGDNIGHVNLIDHMGGDLRAVNAARTSFGRESKELDDRDRRLIAYLGEHIHDAPLRHTYVTMGVECPEFVARQWYKHVVGSEYAFKDMPWSEFSQRYAETPMKLYKPAELRRQSLKNKQTSEGRLGGDHYGFSRDLDLSYNSYAAWLKLGVAREQARMQLPLAVYTRFVWTASLQAIVHFVTLRDESGAQWEIQQYAKAVRSLVRPLAPLSWDALEAGHPAVLRRRVVELEAQLAETYTSVDPQAK